MAHLLLRLALYLVLPDLYSCVECAYEVGALDGVLFPLKKASLCAFAAAGKHVIKKNDKNYEKVSF